MVLQKSLDYWRMMHYSLIVGSAVRPETKENEMSVRDLSGNEIIELARFENTEGHTEAVGIVMAAIGGDDDAKALLAGYLDIAEEYVRKGQIEG